MASVCDALEAWEFDEGTSWRDHDVRHQTEQLRLIEP